VAMRLARGPASSSHLATLRAGASPETMVPPEAAPPSLTVPRSRVLCGGFGAVLVAAFLLFAFVMFCW
jgi:hypothetical protein